MSNETFAILVPLVVLIVMIATGGLLYWEIVRRHPAKKKPVRKDSALGTGFADPRTQTTMPPAEIVQNEASNLQLTARLRENAATTAKIVREANQLAASVEGFTKAVTGAK